MAKSKNKTAKKSSPRVARKSQKSSEVSAGIDDLESNMPAGFTADGARMATLREVLDPAVPTRSHLQLSEDHRFDLAAKRIEMRPEDFQLVIVGYGAIDKTRAIAEVRARSKIGRHLAEIEEIAIARGIKRGTRLR